MSFESPLDKIRKMNADNTAQKELEAVSTAEQEKINQDNIDFEYNHAVDEKESYSQQVIDIKNRISEIKGTQEEMIVEYRETINEVLIAKENETDKEKEGRMKTLQYIRDNFQEVFGAEIKHWKKVGLDKINVSSSLEGAKQSELNAENKTHELYPKTSEGKEEIQKKQLEQTEELWKEVTQYTDGRDNEFFGKIFEEIKQKLSLDEIKDLLESKKQLKEINSNSFIKNEKWERLGFNKWQGENFEGLMVSKEELQSKYNELVSDYNSKDYDHGVELPTFENLRLKKIGRDYSGIDLGSKKEALLMSLEDLESDMKSLKEDMGEKNESFLKIGLKKLETKKNELKELIEKYRDSYKYMFTVESVMQEKITEIYNKNNMYELDYHTRDSIDKKNTIGKLFSMLEEDKSLTQEQNNLLIEEKKLNDKIKTFEEKIKA